MEHPTSAEVADQLSAKYLDTEIVADATPVEALESSLTAEPEVLSTADHVEDNQEELLAQLKVLSQAMARVKHTVPKPRVVSEAKVAARRKANKAAKASRKKNR